MSTRVIIPTDIPDHEVARFLAHVRVEGPDDCHLYVGPGRREKYGHVRIRFMGKDVYAHRVALVLAGRSLGGGDDVACHLCHAGGCCNERHMVIGTIAENNRQRDQDDRRTSRLPTGAAHWSAKLSAEDAERVRAARELGMKAQDVAALFSISKSSVYAIWSGNHYGQTLTGGPR